MPGSEFMVVPWPEGDPRLIRDAASAHRWAPGVTLRPVTSPIVFTRIG